MHLLSFGAGYLIGQAMLVAWEPVAAVVSESIQTQVGLLSEENIGESEEESGEITIDDSRSGHIFSDAEGYMTEDTPENRQKLEDLVNDSDNYLGTDKYGNEWYGQNNVDGTQTWGTVRGGKITNGGINQTPKIYNPETGLSAPEKPSQ